MQLIQAIDELLETYQSIDIRILSFKQDNVWKSIFTIIRFRYESSEELNEIQKGIIQKCNGLVETDEFRLDLASFPITKWNQIKENLNQKFICLRDNLAINFFEPITFNHPLNTTYFVHDKHYVYKNWKQFFGSKTASNSSKPSYDEKLKDQAIERHFSYFDDYLAAIFESNKYEFQREPWVFTFIPVFLHVGKITFEHDKVQVQLTGLSQKNLHLAFNFFRSDYNAKSEFIEQKVVDVNLNDNNDFQDKVISIPIDTKSLGNEFELLITKNKILLEQKRDSIARFWKERSEFTNPINYLFEKFVDFETLEDMLFKHESKDLKDPQKIFERGVSWIMSLMGIPNIMLGIYEKSRNGSSVVSTDILGAFDKDTIVLVNATVGLPKQSDFDRERDYNQNLSQMMTNPKIKLQSVYFTAKEPTESEQSAFANNIVLVGKSKIEMIVNHLKKGDVEKARKAIQFDEF